MFQFYLCISWQFLQLCLLGIFIFLNTCSVESVVTMATSRGRLRDVTGFVVVFEFQVFGISRTVLLLQLSLSRLCNLVNLRGGAIEAFSFVTQLLNGKIILSSFHEYYFQKFCLFMMLVCLLTCAWTFCNLFFSDVV